MIGRAYNSAITNTDEKRIIEAASAMKESTYKRIEKQNPSGEKVIVEFPRNPKIDGEKILQEVRAILYGALRDSLGRASGNE